MTQQRVGLRPGPLATALSVLVAIVEPEAVLGQTLFADPFENGTTCAWTATVGGPLPYLEAFTGVDGSAWPAPWIEAAASVALADLQGGRARFRPTPSFYSLARLVAPVPNRDVEVRFTFVLEDVDRQGVGFYVRQNGGYLQETTPHGSGYAVFVEGFRDTPGIGIWREVDGVEQDIQIDFDPGLGFQDGVPFRVRFRVHQLDASTTALRAKVWPVGDPEPDGWQVDVTDTTPELQGVRGGIALDSWNEIQTPNPITAHTLVDDVEVEQLCSPLVGIGAVETVSESFVFTEGPLWRGDHLLFSDIDANTIYRLDPPSSIGIFRSPSDNANGLALNPASELLAAEHATRRVSRTDSGNVVQTLADNHGGLQFNSPNDVVARSDGTVYFTDPDYGLASPGDRELSFNGVFRRSPAGVVTAEWEGAIGVNQPNGIGLSPSEDRLYVTDTAAGELLVFDVAANGALSGRRTVATGLVIPDGLCVDVAGNVFVATWASTVEVFDPDGIAWGSIAVPLQATNCAFGDDERRSLYVTAHEGLYRVPVTLPGTP